MNFHKSESLQPKYLTGRTTCPAHPNCMYVTVQRMRLLFSNLAAVCYNTDISEKFGVFIFGVEVISRERFKFTQAVRPSVIKEGPRGSPLQSGAIGIVRSFIIRTNFVANIRINSVVNSSNALVHQQIYSDTYKHFVYGSPNRRLYVGESNENLKSTIKIRNTARMSCNLTTIILMV